MTILDSNAAREVIGRCRFARDFAALQLALEISRRTGVEIFTPERMTVELNLSPSDVLNIERRFGVTFGWFEAVRSALKRHRLLPNKKTPWATWLIRYRAQRRAYERWESKQRQRMLNQPGGYLSVRRAAALLRISTARLKEGYAGRRVCGIQGREKQLLFPIWQFDQDRHRLWPAVRKIMAELPDFVKTNDVALLWFFTTRRKELGRCAPSDIILENPARVDQVRFLARKLFA